MQAEQHRFDLIVIGAGINGAAIAREAALCGLKPLLLDRGDIGSGTSSASSRLIHGGLRYLEHLELKLVRESLAERERLLTCAPHLVQPLELVIPLYRGGRRKPWQIRLGLQLYDWLSGRQELPSHRSLSREGLLELMPGLRRDGLVAGASYFDAQVAYPERMIVELVRDAVANGAKLVTYARVTRIASERGAVTGCEWQARSGERASAVAPVVVNAAGPWVDEVLGEIGRRRLIGGTKGSHLVVAPFPGAPRSGVYVEAGSDARPFFILPWNELYLIGTTDERFDGDPSAAAIDEREWQYLVAETERVFPGAAPLGPRVLYTQTGIRPLPHRPRSAEGAITRRHLIQPNRRTRGLYSIVGGKLTTHRALAEDALHTLQVHFPNLPRISPTRDRPLPGALDASEREQLVAAIGGELGRAHAERLWRLYGAAAADVAALAREREITADALPRSCALGAELVHAVRNEWAVTLLDILQRRCMIGLRADFGLQAAPAAADWLCRLGLWDRARAAQEVADYREYARRSRARDVQQVT